MFTWLVALLPEPLKIGLRGILAPIIGTRVAKNWKSAVSGSSGYQSPRTISTIAGSDPVIDRGTIKQNFLGSRYLQVASAILSGLDPEKLKSGTTIRVLDVGGALGQYFYLLRDNVPNLKFEWLILETPALCQLGESQHVDHPGISWTYALNDSSQTFDIVLLSGMIQYVEKPFEFLEMVMQKAQLLIFNRLPLSTKAHNLVCIQRPGLFESKGSYPVHIFSEQLFIAYLLARGQISSRWHVPEDVTVVRFHKTINQGLTFRPNTSTAV